MEEENQQEVELRRRIRRPTGQAYGDTAPETQRFRHPAAKPLSESAVNGHLATPLDFPGMVDEPNPKIGHPLREFYYKASYDIRPFRKDGSVYYAKKYVIEKRTVTEYVKIV